MLTTYHFVVERNFSKKKAMNWAHARHKKIVIVMMASIDKIIENIQKVI
jgi:hypothetical protein